MKGFTLLALSAMVFLLAVEVAPSARRNLALLGCLHRVGPGMPCGLHLDPAVVRNSYHVGVDALRAGEPGKAARILRAHLAGDPNDGAAALALGQALDATGDRLAALAVWRRGGAQPFFANRAQASSRLDLAETALDIGPASPELLALRADLLDQAGRPHEASESYREALAMSPAGTFTAFISQGRLSQLQGDLEGAMTAYRQALAREPLAIDPQYRLGQIALAQHDARGAIETFGGLVRLAPSAIFAWIGLAEAMDLAGDHAGAEATLRDLLPRFPDSGRPAAELGTLALAGGRAAEAVVWLQEATRREPGLVSAHVWLGDAYVASGDRVRAARAYTRARDLLPEDLVIQAKLHQVQGP